MTKVTHPIALSLVGTSTIAVSYGFARYGFGLFVPVLAEEFKLTSAKVGAISSTAYLAYLVAMISAGPMTSRWGPRAPVVLGTVAACTGMTLVAVAQTRSLLVAGVTLAAGSPGWTWAPFSDAAGGLDGRHRNGVLSVVSTGTTLGLLIAGPVALTFNTGADAWRWAWIAFAAAAAGCTAAAARVLPTTAQTVYESQDTTATIIGRRILDWVRRPSARDLLTQAATYGCVGAIVFTFAVDLVTHAGLPITWRYLLFTFIGAGGLSGMCTSMCVDRIGLRRTLRSCLVMLAGAIAALAIAEDSVAVTTIAAITFGAAYMPIAALLTLWSGDVYPDRPTSGFTLVLCALAVGSIIGPAGAGWMIDLTGFSATFLITAALTLLSTLFLTEDRVTTAE